MLTRRSILTGLISLVAAPAIVRANSLMPVKANHVRLARVTLIADSFGTWSVDGIHPTTEHLAEWIKAVNNAPRPLTLLTVTPRLIIGG